MEALSPVQFLKLFHSSFPASWTVSDPLIYKGDLAYDLGQVVFYLIADRFLMQQKLTSIFPLK